MIFILNLLVKLMRAPHHIIRNNSPLDKTINFEKVIGKAVLSKGGRIIGRVAEVRINPQNLELEGILIKRDIFRKPLYIGKSYFAHLSHDALILNMEVSLLIKGRSVITSDGKVIGRVKEITRKGETNNLQEIIVRSLFSRRFVIPASAIKYIGRSIILRAKYNAKKKYIWQKSD